MYPMFVAALLTITRTQKQLRCPSTDEWIQKLWYIQSMEYYSALKKSTFELVLMRWMNLEPIVQGEVSQKEKDKCCILTHVSEIQKDGTDEFIFRSAMEKQTQKTNLRTWLGGEEEGGEMYGGVTWKLTLPYVKQIVSFAV